MSFDWPKVLKLKARYFFAALVITCLFLFTSDDFARATGIEEFRSAYRGWIGVLFFVSLGLWLIGLCDIWSAKLRRSKWEVSVLQRLRNLSPDEQFFILYCLATDQKTVLTEFIDPVMHSLCQKGIFVKAAGQGSILAWPYTMPDFVWEFLHQSEGLLYEKQLLQSPELLQKIRLHDERIMRLTPRI